MALTIYSELIDEVQSWLSRSATDLSDAQVGTFVSMAEDRIHRELRIRELETSADLTINAQSIALPTTVPFLAARRVYISGSPNSRLGYLTPASFWLRFMSSDTDKPKGYTIEGDNIIFGPSPDSTYTGKLLYWGRLGAFSSDSDTNSLLTRHRGLYLYGSLLEASLFLGDDARVLTWAAAFDDAVEKVQKMDRRDRIPAGSPEMTVDGVNADADVNVVTG